MSKNEPTAPAVDTKSEGRKGREWSPKFERTVRFYDANFDSKEDKAKGEVVPAKTLQEALASTNPGFNFTDEELRDVINNAAKLRLIEIRTKEVMGDDAISERALMDYVEPFRLIKRFAALNPNGNAEGKKAQTAAIIKEKVQGDPDAIEAIRAAMALSSDTDDAAPSDEPSK